MIRELARTAPNNVQALSALANIEDNEHALVFRRRATMLDPRDASAWGNLAGGLTRVYKYEEAITAHEREIALAPDAAISYAVQASTYLLWHGDTAAARQTIERAGPTPAWAVRFPSGITGGAIWGHALPQTFLHARDTLTLPGYLAGAGGIAPELYHLMKLRHLVAMGRAGPRVHADSLVKLLEPTIERDASAGWFGGWFSRRATLAEAYAIVGRSADAGRQTDLYVTEMRQRLSAARDVGPEQLCHTLYNAAFVDVMVGRKDVAVARLTEALRMPCGHRISRALLRADPSWASLRGDPSFERLVAGRD